MSLDKEPEVKALGIFWNPLIDKFGFNANYLCKSDSAPITKRRMLSEIAKLFDPIGWLSPIIINAKILMQSIWKEQLDWDELVPDHILNKWNQLKLELQSLKNVSIPRTFLEKMNPFCTKYYLVGFSDAAEQAYSACVYVCRYSSDGRSDSTLIASKTRVAPVKQISLPKLELSGALLLAEFMVSVKDSLKLKFENIAAFTDSTITLGWIMAHSYQYKTFVANRITKIQECVPRNKWGFVPGIENPADCASRGISTTELINHPLWWHGPQWLKNGPPRPRLPLDWEMQPEEERKAVQCNMTTATLSRDVFSKYSSLTTMIRVYTYVFRSLDNIRKLFKYRREGKSAADLQPARLTTIELNETLMKLIKIAQEQEFQTELTALRQKKLIPRSCKVLQLNPVIDDNNILRVGGRLRNANIPNDRKYPVLLPRHHRLTYLIIRHAHLSNLHAGQQTTLSVLQQRYWIVNGKDAVRNVIRKCVRCTRHRASTMQQVMGDLPSYRVNPSHPFNNCGLDYAGPFLIKPPLPRSTTTLKAYLAIFICCATRAIHLEIVSSACTPAFIAALRRFVARRGIPSHMYSDNGTNFVGADKEIQEFEKLAKSEAHNNEVSSMMSREGITWHFNPPAAPQFGGLWEAGVKSTKFHLKRVMGLTRLTYEEFSTLTTQIEAILNSRPITPESTDPSDLRALTPGHFLIGQPLTTIPEPDLTDVPLNRLVRWQVIQQMMQQFWKRWSAEYISRMQMRPKRLLQQEPIKMDAMVILKDENLPPMQWKLGRVIKLHPGADGHVRVVTVQTATGELKRPIAKVCLLPIETNMPSDDYGNKPTEVQA